MNLFLASTPFQLINALEAIEHYQCNNNIIIVREQENENAEREMEELLAQHNWFGIIRLERNPTRSLYPRLVLVLKSQKAQSKHGVQLCILYRIPKPTRSYYTW